MPAAADLHPLLTASGELFAVERYFTVRYRNMSSPTSPIPPEESARGIRLYDVESRSIARVSRSRARTDDPDLHVKPRLFNAALRICISRELLASLSESVSQAVSLSGVDSRARAIGIFVTSRAQLPNHDP